MTDRQPVQGRARVTNWLYQPGSQFAGNAMAFLHGAGDSLPFGVADGVSSAVRTAGDALRTNNWSHLANDYRKHMGEEQAQDQNEAQHYGLARTTGQILGTIAQIAALGPAEGAVASGFRIAKTTAMIGREGRALGGAGAVLGVGSQAVSDLARRRISSPGDYAGAAVGGAVGALTSRSGLGSRAGALAGATTSVAQDVANGRIPSLSRASEAASDGAILGAAGGGAGRWISDKLPWQAKGRLGELLSRPRTGALGQETLPITNKAKYLSRGYTVPDHWLADGSFVESKFGRGIKGLSKAQNRAFDELKDKYRVDHWLPQDIGALVGFLPAAQGYLTASNPSPTPDSN